MTFWTEDTFEDCRIELEGQSYSLDGKLAYKIQESTLTSCDRWDQASSDWVACEAPEGWQEAVESAQQSDAEERYERSMESFYGGSSGPSLREQQISGLRLKG